MSFALYDILHGNAWTHSYSLGNHALNYYKRKIDVYHCSHRDHVTTDHERSLFYSKYLFILQFILQVITELSSGDNFKQGPCVLPQLQ